MSVVEIEAPAKVNLRLRVLAQETDGFHSLESLFCAISLSDRMRIERGGGDVSLRVSGGVETGPERDNLVVRAARAYLLATGGVGQGVRIGLEKRIPSAAGLGGGSSDAAATLLALNALDGEPLDPRELLQLAVALGSDVPFFLCGSALALGWSRGERLLALPPLPARPLLVAHPGVPMPTGAAFQRIAELRGPYEPAAFVAPAAALGGWDSIAALAVNDFDPVADERIPQVADGKRLLREAGAGIVLLAGSGASIFGVFENPAERDAAAPLLSAAGFATWAATTLERLPAPRVDPPPGLR
jgi:4-diphosphocytidyl-2-C-methyl-D-erythritol kinase